MPVLVPYQHVVGTFFEHGHCQLTWKVRCWLTAGCAAQIESEFPGLLPIRESLIKYVFEPNAARKEEVKAAVRSMRGRV